MTERLSLLDLRRKPGIVKYQGSEIKFHGLTSRDIFDLMARYDEVNKFLVGLAISTAEAIRNAPSIQSAIIVRGMRENLGGDLTLAQAEAVALSLPAQLALILMTAIWNATFTEGFGPFVKAVRQMAEAANVGDDLGKGQDMKSGRPSRPMRPNTPTVPPVPDGTSPPENSPSGTSSPPAATSDALETASTS